MNNLPHLNIFKVRNSLSIRALVNFTRFKSSVITPKRTFTPRQNNENFNYTFTLVQSFLNKMQFQKSLDLVVILQPNDLRCYSILIEHLQKQEPTMKNLETMEKLFEMIVKNGMQIPKHLIQVAMQQALYLNSFEFCQKFYKFLENEETFYEILHHILVLFLESNQIGRAKKILQVLQNQFSIKPETTNECIHHFMKHSLVQEATQLFTSCHDKNDYTFIYYIRGLIFNKRVQEALHVFNEYRKNVPNKRVVVYDRVLASLRDLKKPMVAKDLLFDILKDEYIKGLLKSDEKFRIISLFNHVIGAFVDVQLSNEASELTTKMYQYGIKPNVYTYTLLCKSWRDPDRLLSLFNQMKDEYITPNVKCYTAAIESLCASGKTDMAIEFFNQAYNSGLYLDTKFYNSFMSGLLLNDRKETILQIWNIMQNQKIPKNSDSYAIIIPLLVDLSKYREAMKLYNDMMIQNVKPDRYFYEKLLRQLSSHGRVDEFLEIFQKAKIHFTTTENLEMLERLGSKSGEDAFKVRQEISNLKYNIVDLYDDVIKLVNP